MPNVVLRHMLFWVGAAVAIGFAAFLLQSERTVEPVNSPAEDGAMQELARLIELAGPRLFEGGVCIISGDRELDRRRKEAAQAVRRRYDFRTVSKALEHPDPQVVFWAVMVFPANQHPSDSDAADTWRTLLPMLRKHAVGAKALIRDFALQKLRCYPQERAFVETVEL